MTTPRGGGENCCKIVCRIAATERKLASNRRWPQFQPSNRKHCIQIVIEIETEKEPSDEIEKVIRANAV